MHGLCQLPRPAAQLPEVGRVPTLLHELNARNRFKSPKQNRFADTFFSRHHVDTIVHPIDEIDIHGACWTEHHGIACGFSSKGMGSRIIGEIRFRLNNSANSDSFLLLMHEKTAEQVSCYADGILGIKGVIKDHRVNCSSAFAVCCLLHALWSMLTSTPLLRQGGP